MEEHKNTESINADTSEGFIVKLPSLLYLPLTYLPRGPIIIDGNFQRVITVINDKKLKFEKTINLAGSFPWPIAIIAVFPWMMMLEESLLDVSVNSEKPNIRIVEENVLQYSLVIESKNFYEAFGIMDASDLQPEMIPIKYAKHFDEKYFIANKHRHVKKMA